MGRWRLGKNAMPLCVCVPALAIAGCGGGGGGGGVQPLPPAPPPPFASPTPPPPPPPSGFNDEEYGRSTGAAAAKALAAYEAGATGAGVNLAIVDMGTVDPSHSEFVGRIHPVSRDLVGAGRYNTSQHGIEVASVAAAARNGVGIQGVAFNSTLITFDVSAIDCSPTFCRSDPTAFAQGIDLALQNGARVISFSAFANPFDAKVVAAVRRAGEAGVVMVFAGGNEPGSPNPAPLAMEFARQLASYGVAVLAGAHDSSRQLASFSNRAGESREYLTALGAGVAIVNNSGQVRAGSGTSFSAPVVAGAVALLAQAFPHLTGRQIVEILFSSADDAGALGFDSVYGNGRLNITRAFQPSGSTTLAGSAVAISIMNNGQLSRTMGDGGRGAEGAIILDRYSRAYALDISQTLQRAPQEQPLRQAIGSYAYHTVGATAPGVAFTITSKRAAQASAELDVVPMSLTLDEVRQASAVAGTLVARVTAKSAVAFGSGESGQSLRKRLANDHGTAFIVAPDPTMTAGFDAGVHFSVGARHDLVRLGISLTSERGEVADLRSQHSMQKRGYSINSLTLDRRFSPVALALGVSRLAEEGTVLGGRFSAAVGASGSVTDFVEGSTSVDLGAGLNLMAKYRRGWTSTTRTSGFLPRGRLSTEAFALDFCKRGAFLSGDILAVRLAQPLRLRSGGLDLSIPTTFDTASGKAGTERRFLNLAPSGREVDREISYSMALRRGHLAFNVFQRSDPGHISGTRDDMGGAFRFGLAF